MWGDGVKSEKSQKKRIFNVKSEIFFDPWISQRICSNCFFIHAKACYVGCFNDRPTANLTKDFEFDISLGNINFIKLEELTIESCIKQCRAYVHYKYAALQNG